MHASSLCQPSRLLLLLARILTYYLHAVDFKLVSWFLMKSLCGVFFCLVQFMANLLLFKAWLVFCPLPYLPVVHHLL